MTRPCIRPGQPWLDTEGKRIHAHGGSIMHLDDAFYWYGENKEHSTADGSIWHWGVRCYRSTDLCRWTDLGLIIPPDLDDPASPLHPSRMMDRPHIVHDVRRRRFVCWVKVMESDAVTQRATVLEADNLLGPYRIVRREFLPLGASAGDLDLVIDPTDGRGYYYYERPHTHLVCAELNETYDDLTGRHSTHFHLDRPPHVREAPAYFNRRGLHYLVTSGTTAYYPNPSQLACARSFHGPWEVLGDPHPDDPSRTSFHSQVSSVFRHPGKKDLYIALADRWLPDYLEPSDTAVDAFDRYFAAAPGEREPLPQLAAEDTARADYVWLPFRWEGTMGYLDWRDEWPVDEFD